MPTSDRDRTAVSDPTWQRLVSLRRRILAVLAATAVGIGLAQALDAGQEPDKPRSSPYRPRARRKKPR
jgi:hypothetical protein